MTRSPFDRFGGRLPPGLGRPRRGPFATLLAALGAVIAVALGLVFWVTALAVIAVLVVVALGWFWCAYATAMQYLGQRTEAEPIFARTVRSMPSSRSTRWA